MLQTEGRQQRHSPRPNRLTAGNHPNRNRRPRPRVPTHQGLRGFELEGPISVGARHAPQHGPIRGQSRKAVTGFEDKFFRLAGFHFPRQRVSQLSREHPREFEIRIRHSQGRHTGTCRCREGKPHGFSRVAVAKSLFDKLPNEPIQVRGLPFHPSGPPGAARRTRRCRGAAAPPPHPAARRQIRIMPRSSC